MRKLHAGLIFLHLLYLPVAQHAQSAVSLQAPQQVHMLGPEVLVRSLSPQTAFSPQEALAWPDQAFSTAVQPNFLFGLSNKAHCLRYRVVNHSNRRQSLLLELVNPNFTELRHYQFKEIGRAHV